MGISKAGINHGLFSPEFFETSMEGHVFIIVRTGSCVFYPTVGISRPQRRIEHAILMQLDNQLHEGKPYTFTPTHKLLIRRGGHGPGGPDTPFPVDHEY